MAANLGADLDPTERCRAEDEERLKLSQIKLWDDLQISTSFKKMQNKINYMQ